MQPNYIERLNVKKSTAAQASKEQSELASMIREMKMIQAATLAGQSKPTVILTDQTDLGPRLEKMVKSFTEAVKSSDVTSLSKDQVIQLKELKSALTSLTSAVAANKPDNSALLSAIKALKLSTVVNVPDLPTPTVTVKERKIDFSSLENTMRELWERPTELDEPINLENYRAQDITEKGDMQYVGFVNPDGAWYIIENDVKGSKMRYVFGNGGYARAFSKAATYQYQLLDEAIASAT